MKWRFQRIKENFEEQQNLTILVEIKDKYKEVSNFLRSLKFKLVSAKEIIIFGKINNEILICF